MVCLHLKLNVGVFFLMIESAKPLPNYVRVRATCTDLSRVQVMRDTAAPADHHASPPVVRPVECLVRSRALLLDAGHAGERDEDAEDHEAGRGEHHPQLGQAREERRADGVLQRAWGERWGGGKRAKR